MSHTVLVVLADCMLPLNILHIAGYEMFCTCEQLCVVENVNVYTSVCGNRKQGPNVPVILISPLYVDCVMPCTVQTLCWTCATCARVTY